MCANLLTETTKRAIGQAVDTKIDSKRTYIVMSEEAMGYPAVRGMFANFQAVGEGLYVITVKHYCHHLKIGRASW